MQYDVYPSQALDVQQKKEVYEILNDCDREFLPPLSSRKSFSQTSFNRARKPSSLEKYYNSLFTQDKQIVLCYKQNKIIAFISYGTVSPLNEYKNSYYISTVCVLKNYRNQGIASAMYNALIEQAIKDKKESLHTRTWSTNNSHICLLHSFGFNKVKEIIDDRGKGISTVYYVKPMKQPQYVEGDKL